MTSVNLSLKDESQPYDLPPDETVRPLVEAAEGSGFTPTISREQIAHFKNDPEFKQMMMEMFAENFQSPPAGNEISVPEGEDTTKNPEVVAIQNRPTGNLPTVKSPSETSIYEAAFRKAVGDTNQVIDKISNFVESI